MVLTRGEKEWALYAAADIIYWVCANIKPQTSPLYWTESQRDEALRIINTLREMEAESRSRALAGRKAARTRKAGCRA